MYEVHVAETAAQAKTTIESLHAKGYLREEIYIFAHDAGYSADLTNITDTGSVGLEEQGVLDTLGNLFKSRGDELRSKMVSLGLTQVEAEGYEERLDEGRLVVIGSRTHDGDGFGDGEPVVDPMKNPGMMY